MAEGTDEAIERHRREVIEDRTQLQAQSAMRCQYGITSDLRRHLAIPQDEVRQDGEHRTTRGTLEPPDGDAAQTDAGIMRMAREASTATIGRFVFELKAKGEEKSEDAFDKRFAIAQELIIGRFV